MSIEKGDRLTPTTLFKGVRVKFNIGFSLRFLEPQAVQVHYRLELVHHLRRVSPYWIFRDSLGSLDD